MTTKRSPLRALKAQASVIAANLKAAERGEMVDPTGKVAAARAGAGIRFAVVMDDRVLSIEMPWTTIRDTNEVGIAEWILRQMRGAGEMAQ